MDGSRIEVNWAKPADKNDALRAQSQCLLDSSSIDQSGLATLFGLSGNSSPLNGSPPVLMNTTSPPSVLPLSLPVYNDNRGTEISGLSSTLGVNQRSMAMGYHGSNTQTSEHDATTINLIRSMLMQSPQNQLQQRQVEAVQQHLHFQHQERFLAEKNEKRIREALAISRILQNSRSGGANRQSHAAALINAQPAKSQRKPLLFNQANLMNVFSSEINQRKWYQS